MDQLPQIQQKAPKPEGLLPKNVQSWLLISMAFAMVGIMWLTGGKKVQTPGKTSPAVALPAPVEVNETKINELQSRIEQLQRQQLDAQSALSQQTRLMGEASQATQPTGAGNTPSESNEDPIKAERKRREYASLFASNIALSFRRSTAPEKAADSEPSRAGASEGPDPLEPQLLAQLQNLAVPRVPQTLPPTSSPRPLIRDGKKEDGTGMDGTAIPPDTASKGTYVLFEGTILETVLINRLEGSFAGPVECLVSTNVYSNDRQHLLIPAGSKVIGETRKVDAFGQSRLAVVFHRLLMPDGYSVTLDQFKGLDQIGDTGLRDQVNNHYLRIFGVSLAIGALGAVAEGGTSGPLTATGSDLIRQGFAESTAQSSAQILDKFLNVMPTITIREGHRVKVFLSNDLALPDYHNHKPPSDF